LDVKILNPDSFEILGYNQEFYGVYYNVNDKDYIYSNVSGKIFNINGEYIINMGWDPDYLLPSGYVPVSMDNDITNFINLKSGKVVYSIKDVYGFTIDTTTQKGYIIQGIKKSSNEEYDDYNFKIYDSKGYELFDGEVFDGFYTENSVFVTWKNGTFKTYNSNYQNTYTSKKYDSVEDIWEDYILVVDDKKLNLIDYKGNVLTTFIEDYWNNDEYVYHSMLSGWYTENGKNGIYLVIQGGDVSKQEILKNNPEMTLEDLEKVKQASKDKMGGKISPAWRNWESEMQKKAVLKRGLKDVEIKVPSEFQDAYFETEKLDNSNYDLNFEDRKTVIINKSDAIEAEFDEKTGETKVTENPAKQEEIELHKTDDEVTNDSDYVEFE